MRTRPNFERMNFSPVVCHISSWHYDVTEWRTRRLFSTTNQTQNEIKDVYLPEAFFNWMRCFGTGKPQVKEIITTVDFN